MLQSIMTTLTQTRNTKNKNNNGRHYPSQPTKVMTPSTFLEDLAADWPTPAKHATLEDLHRMAMVIIAGMPTQQRAKFKCIAEDEYQKKDTEEVDMFSAEALNTPIQTLVKLSMSSDNIGEASLRSTASEVAYK